MVSSQPVCLRWNIAAREGHVTLAVRDEGITVTGRNECGVIVSSSRSQDRCEFRCPSRKMDRKMTRCHSLPANHTSGSNEAEEASRWYQSEGQPACPCVWAIRAHLCTHCFSSFCKRTCPPMDLTHFLLLLVPSAFVKRDKSQLWQLTQCCSHKLIN